MDRTDAPQRGTRTGAVPDVGPSDDAPETEIEPESWRALIEFRNQFSSDAVFGVLANPDDGAAGFWIVRDIDKVRPAAVPLGDPATFDLSVLGPDGTVVDDLRLTIEEIEHVRVSDPSDEPHPEDGDET